MCLTTLFKARFLVERSPQLKLEADQLLISTKWAAVLSPVDYRLAFERKMKLSSSSDSATNALGKYPTC
jgi:hypothetical protein